MADFAPARAAQESDFADAEGREIIVKHEALEGFAFQHIQPLLVLAGAERGRHQSLRLAAREQRRAVRAGQQADLHADGTHLVEGAPVGPLMLVDDVVAEQFLLEGVEKVGGLAPLDFIVFVVALDQCLADLRNLAVAFELDVLRGVHGLVERGLGLLPDLSKQRLVPSRRLEFALADSESLEQLFFRGQDPADLAVCVLDGLDDRGLRDLARRGFHHYNRFFAPCHHDVQQARLGLCIRRVRHQLPIHQTHADAGDRRRERNVGKVKRGGPGHQADGVGVVVRVGRKHHGNNLRFVAIALGEHGAHGAVNQPAGEDFLFCGTPFALEKPAGNFPRRVSVLAVIHRQWKEINTLARLVRTRRRQHYGVAVTYHRGTVRLPGDLTHFDAQIISAERNAHSIHKYSPSQLESLR